LIIFSSAAAVGVGSKLVSLSFGEWFFEATPRGPRTYFTAVC
jgi:hypothetical protein